MPRLGTMADYSEAAAAGRCIARSGPWTMLVVKTRIYIPPHSDGRRAVRVLICGGHIFATPRLLSAGARSVATS
jgi:hypothetical protein